jgi:putative FmdB family regulatory protein
MPIYDYSCSNCGQTTEVIHGIDAPAPRFCPVCGAEGALRKAFATPAVHFKGSGWAKKDRSSLSGSRSKSGTSASSSDSSEGSTKDAGSSAKPTSSASNASAPKSSGATAGED